MQLRLSRGRFLSIVLVMAFALPASAGSKHYFGEAASILENAVTDRAFPGCTVAVGNRSGILWSAAFGHFDYESGKRVERDTIYDLASLTKVVGTTSVYARLVEKGKISLSDPVSKYLPKFVGDAADEAERAKRQKITIEHLLTHTGGIASWKPYYRTVHSYADLIKAISQTPLASDPGEKFSYSDPGMMLLGEIAARATGKKLPVLENELFFHPIKMQDTLRNPPGTLLHRIPPTERWPDKETFVHGVVHDENSRAGEGITGHAGLFSTTGDLSKLAREWLRSLDGKSKLISQPVAENFTRERGTLNRSLGWGIASENEMERTGFSEGTFGHTGFTGTSISIDPKRGLFIILLSNRVHPSRDNGKVGRLRSELASAILRAWDAQDEHRVAGWSFPGRSGL